MPPKSQEQIKREGRVAKLATKRPKGYFGGDTKYDKEIMEGMQDEEASKTHQDKIQKMRKDKNWKGIKTASEQWGSIRGFR